MVRKIAVIHRLLLGKRIVMTKQQYEKIKESVS